MRLYVQSRNVIAVRAHYVRAPRDRVVYALAPWRGAPVNRASRQLATLLLFECVRVASFPGAS